MICALSKIVLGPYFGLESMSIFLSSHLNKTTTYEDPRKWLPIDPEDIPEPRLVELTRDPELGFGFVAGSEKPVIVR